MTAIGSLFTDQRKSGLPIRAKYKHFKTIWERTTDNSPTVSNSSFWKLWSSKQSVETVYNCSVFLFASSQYIFYVLFRVSFHVVGPRDSFCVKILPSWYFFSCSGRYSWFEHFLVLTDNVFVRFTFTLSESQMYMIETWCWYVKINKFHQVLPHWSHTLFFQPFWCHPRIPKRTILVFDEQNRHSQFGTFSHTSPNRTSSKCLSTRGQQAGDRTNFVQEEPLGLRCLTKIWATCVGEDVSIYLGIQTLEFLTTLERPPFLPGCKLILRRRLVQHILVISQQHPSLLQQSFARLTILVLWKPRMQQSHLLARHDRSRHQPKIWRASGLSPWECSSSWPCTHSSTTCSWI